MVSFLVSCPTKNDTDKETVLRTVGVFLSDVHEVTRLKTSSFFDIEEISEKDIEPDDKLLKKVKETGQDYKTCYRVHFAIYNKLGTTNLRSFQKYFRDKTDGAYVRVVDPNTGIKIRFSHFTITYYFIDFILSQYGTLTWDLLLDLLQERDRGYSKLQALYRKNRRASMQRKAVRSPSILLLTNATKRLQGTDDRDEAVLAINDILDAANDLLGEIETAYASVERHPVDKAAYLRRKAQLRRLISRRRRLSDRD